ncbi:MAG: EamA family transporter [Bacteroidales bacterium]
MHYLLLAIFFSSCIIVTFRLFSILRIDNLQAITANYLIAALLCFFIWEEDLIFSELYLKPWFPWSMINGVLFILVFFIFAQSAQKAGVAVTAVASKMSVIIPVAIGFFIYSDHISILKIAGILTAFPAFYLIFKKPDKPLEPDKKYIFLPLILFLGTGSNDSIMKHAQKFHIGNEFLLFLGVIFTFSLIIGSVFLIRKLYISRQKFDLRNVLAGFLLGFFNFSSTYFFLKGLSVFESSVFFPVFNVSIVSMGALIGLIIFKERLWWKNWIGIILAILTILFIALA